MKERTGEQESIEELAECIKELCRIHTTIETKLPDHIVQRFEDVYAKASRARNRVNQ